MAKKRPPTTHSDHLSERSTPDLPLDAPPSSTLDPALITYLKSLENRLESITQALKSPPTQPPTPPTPPERLIPAPQHTTSKPPASKFATSRPNDCQPLLIGSRDGISPNELDFIVGTTPHQLASNLLHQMSRWSGYSPHTPFHTPIVLIPIPLYPKAIPHPNRPIVQIGTSTLPNYELGATQIRESFATVTLPIRGIPTEISLSGFGTITSNVTAIGTTPIHRLHTKLQNALAFESYSLLQEGDYSLSNDTPTSQHDGPFIPSQQPTQPHSNPSPSTPFHHPHAPPIPTVDKSLDQ
jgi:hypothetical protein